ncbi:A/G-specific adenine glycosylase [Myroides guanonis]|uniref:Adenine DNA glycosylase n=1 Tax=Myroides guanonis TaxID=1150112 RepID=A0A1I3Q8Q2_9FLAO|nr:A/G-specific adenine glycosylase [Myroides guanonis]SFJ30035.1 A/G-specific DNA-adenine glycosylase [Myroides guanonis]
MHFSNKLTAWYLQNRRSLPWRETKDPYAIWLSEIILQQTRVAQGLPYFEAFLHEFPTVFDLANAEEDKVMHLWQGLGYYSRARNLHATAKMVAFDYNGIFPNNSKELLKLKGVGEYTAAAIASFSYNEVIPVVDGNVFRVLARRFGINSDISTLTTKREFQALAASLIPKDSPALFNQAIMEFGALQCTPQSPDCTICPFQLECIAYQTNEVSSLPVKLSKTKVRDRHFDYLIFLDPNGNTQIQQRTKKDIWQQLYEFPLIESTTTELIDIKQQLTSLFPNLAIKQIELCNTDPIIHKLSHQKLHIRFWKIHTETALNNSSSIEELQKIGFPIVIHNFINNNLIDL